jgi:outer membrane protein assembly factor BamB
VRNIRVFLGVGLILVLLGCNKDQSITTGTLEVNSIPRGADIFLIHDTDTLTDTLTGYKTNHVFEELEEGECTIRLMLSGYVPWDTSVTLGACDTVIVNATFHEIEVGALRWRYKAGRAISCAPAIGSNGTIYFGSLDDSFYALDTNGNLVWSYSTGYPIESSPAVGSDGCIYFGSYDNCFYALTSTGALRWEISTSDNVVTSAGARVSR